MVVQDGALSTYLIIATRLILCSRRGERTRYGAYRAPDKGEVGGSSPPRPTIYFASKYAAILTFFALLQQMPRGGAPNFSSNAPD